MNYRNLLKKYMVFIIDQEGMSYVHRAERSTIFTAGDVEELRSIDTEIDNED